MVHGGAAVGAALLRAGAGAGAGAVEPVAEYQVDAVGAEREVAEKVAAASA
ncbi:hypothetical protein [Dyella sp. M7H15-1]|uniref:hypothetical protein n=1 Tax=Dyella sp. M7H15-1 TaxID=2501295 RepID=UPI0013E8C03A|nr:hypothetical protein [Dyella sp. M7H15-1]